MKENQWTDEYCRDLTAATWAAEGKGTALSPRSPNSVPAHPPPSATPPRCNRERRGSQRRWANRTCFQSEKIHTIKLSKVQHSRNYLFRQVINFTPYGHHSFLFILLHTVNFSMLMSITYK